MNGNDSGRPNIVLIMSDQHNAHVMRNAGDAIVQTPSLDALASEGVRFDACYCPYPLCIPSRMGFMTGQYPSEVDIWDNGNVLDSGVRTFAHALSEAGYETALCGRMHFVGPDQLHGFEKRLYGDCDHFLSSEIRGSGSHRTNGQTRYAVEVSGHGRMGYEEFDKRVTEKACEFVARREDGRPYCMVVGYALPHNPLICERELFEYYMESLPAPEQPSAGELAKLNPAIRAWRERRGVNDISPEHARRARAAYYGLVSTLDRNIGRVVEAVKGSRGGEATVIIYCGDHGDMAGEHGMWWKSNYYEGSVRVPLIVSCPSRFVGGRSVASVVNLIDVGPTLIELARGEPLPKVSGRSLAGFLEGKPPGDWSNETMAQYVGDHGDRPSCMIRSGPWKLMFYSEFDSYLLFNLEEDPGELNDRAGDSSCAEVAKALLAKVRTRFSAERMIEGNARQRSRQEVLSGEGHAETESRMYDRPSKEANVFDFSQVPGWEAIRERARADR